MFESSNYLLHDLNQNIRRSIELRVGLHGVFKPIPDSHDEVFGDVGDCNCGHLYNRLPF